MIIGVLGFIGSGKGTVGEILEHHFNFTQVSFAGHLKDVTSVLFGWNRELLEGKTEESRKFREKPDNFWSKKIGENFTPRLALQLLGTEVGRQIFHEDFWVYALENKLLQMGENKNVVVTDVRFKNEIDWIHSKGGILIEVRRGMKPSWYNIAADANQGSKKSENYMLEESGIHESEWRWIGHSVDFVIDNNGSVEDLKGKISERLKFYLKSDNISSVNNRSL